MYGGCLLCPLYPLLKYLIQFLQPSSITNIVLASVFKCRETSSSALASWEINYFFYSQTQERMSLNSLKQQRRSRRQFETTRETTIARHHNTEPLAFRELKEAPSANQQINHSSKEKYAWRGVPAPILPVYLAVWGQEGVTQSALNAMFRIFVQALSRKFEVRRSAQSNILCCQCSYKRIKCGV